MEPRLCWYGAADRRRGRFRLSVDGPVEGTWQVTLPALFFAALAFLSWRRTGDVVRDWGRELYTAWRISEGDLLYRDVASLYGPLSQTLNGAIFTLAGVGHSTLLVSNLVIIAVCSALLIEICTGLADRRTATICVLLFLGIFGFGHLGPLGNYNFLTPYSHEATHGTALCLVLVWGLVRWVRSGSRVAGAVTGLAAGATWLTKPEVALAASIALLAGLAFALHDRLVSRRSVLVTLAPALLLPVSLFGLVFAVALGPRAAVSAILNPVAVMVAANPFGQEFYLGSMGLDNVAGNLLRLSGTGLCSIILYYAAARLGSRLPARWRVPVAAAAVALLIILSVPFGHWRLWLALAWVLPACCLVGIGFLRAPCACRDDAVRRAGFAAWLALSSAYLLKLGLQPRFHQYGFYLALPSTVLMALLAVHHAPSYLKGRGRDAGFARALSTASLLGLATVLFLASVSSMNRRTFEVAEGRDLLRVRPPESDPRSGTISHLLDRLAPVRGSTGLTLAVVPEGASVNYWLRVPSSTRYPVLLPPEVAAYGGELILQDFLKHPPDLIVEMERDLREYGLDEEAPLPTVAGLDSWIESSYQRPWEVRERSTDGRSHRLVLYSRRSTENPSP